MEAMEAMEAMERTKDEESKKFKSHNIHFDFNILLKIKESMVGVSSSCMYGPCIKGSLFSICCRSSYLIWKTQDLLKEITRLLLLFKLGYFRLIFQIKNCLI